MSRQKNISRCAKSADLKITAGISRATRRDVSDFLEKKVPYFDLHL